MEISSQLQSGVTHLHGWISRMHCPYQLHSTAHPHALIVLVLYWPITGIKLRKFRAHIYKKDEHSKENPFIKNQSGSLCSYWGYLALCRAVFTNWNWELPLRWSQLYGAINRPLLTDSVHHGSIQACVRSAKWVTLPGGPQGVHRGQAEANHIKLLAAMLIRGSMHVKGYVIV